MVVKMDQFDAVSGEQEQQRRSGQVHAKGLTQPLLPAECGQEHRLSVARRFALAVDAKHTVPCSAEARRQLVRNAASTAAGGVAP